MTEFKKLNRKRYWRSSDDFEASSAYVEQHTDEFPSGHFDEDTSSQGGPSRRQFMGLMGASMALAGSTTLTGCIRKKQQYIVPYNKRPENLIPGEPVFFRSAMSLGGYVQGLHVETQDFRPTKVEGNPDHPMNNPALALGANDPSSKVVAKDAPLHNRIGGTTVWAQSSVLDLYDPDRSKDGPRVTALGNLDDALKTRVGALAQALSSNRNPGPWVHAAALLGVTFDDLAKTGGEGLALLVEASPSPTLSRLYTAFQKRFSKAKIYQHDPLVSVNQETAFAALFGDKVIKPVYNLDKARVIVAVDGDVLSGEGDSVRNGRLFANGRRSPETQEINRLYSLTPMLSPTSISADERLRIPASQVGPFLAAVATKVLASKDVPAAASLKTKLAKLVPGGIAEELVKGWNRRVKAAKESYDKIEGKLKEHHEKEGEGHADKKDGDHGHDDKHAHEIHAMERWFKQINKKDVETEWTADSIMVRWVETVAADLIQNEGRAVVMVSARQPAWVHGVGALINVAIKAAGSVVQYFEHQGLKRFASIETLIADMDGGSVSTLLALGGNPAYSASHLGFNEAAGKVARRIHLSMHRDETSMLGEGEDDNPATWHLPSSHFLESWCDWQSSNGIVSVQQPMIAPLFEVISAVQLLDAIAAQSLTDGVVNPALQAISDPVTSDAGYHAVRFDTWGTEKALRTDDNTWRTSLFRGVLFTRKGNAMVVRSVARDQTTALVGRAQWAAVESQTPDAAPAAPSPETLEINFVIDPSVADGRFANNGWLQELPDPVSKLTWDNALYLSPVTAKALGVKSKSYATIFKGDLVSISVDEKSLDKPIPVMVLPGMADNVLAVSIGYGRDPQFAGKVASGGRENTVGRDGAGGFNVNPLRTKNPWIASVAASNVGSTGERYALATTQEHWNLSPGFGFEERPMVQEMSMEAFADKAWLNHHFDHLRQDNKYFKSHLFTQSNFHDQENVEEYRGRSVPQWGMVIDLNICGGCNACVVACQAENNIPVVGKERVTNGREMHWLRIDRYYRGESPEDPESVVIQPLGCMHCQTAPCETVCPVAATVHSPEGTNDMAYNRCIGTRYCSNNCPYKVRRFNFFNYQKENAEENALGRMQKNPDVTVRFRGVMEKCTYCIQRVMEARITAKRYDGWPVKDGGVITACQQVCPSQAITFGNIADKSSTVAQLKALDRNYGVLVELNTQPRTTYLAQLRNMNVALHPWGTTASPVDDHH